MNKVSFSIIFIILSLIWLIYFSINAYSFLVNNKEIMEINEDLKEIDNLPFYERSVKNLISEFSNVSKQSFTTKSSTEFIAKIPTLAEICGIQSMKVENAGVRQENNLEITELSISTVSSFPDIANFIDLLERSQLPIQISSINMKFEDNKLYCVMTIKIYKKIIEE